MATKAMNANLTVLGLTQNTDGSYPIEDSTYYTKIIDISHILHKSLFIEVSNKTAGNIEIQLQYSWTDTSASDVDGDSPVTISSNGRYIYTPNSETNNMPPLADYAPFIRFKITSTCDEADIKLKLAGLNA